ncbi:MAG TPA: DUF2848 domain-containing protein [Pseudolabrys sp.]|jgi:hypothetical protein|nr:DUF2848 domain-containing protein [Pseudolabrys sp.]
MLTFTRPGESPETIRVAFDTLIVAGWTGRDTAALTHHIEELAALGVPRPSSVPVFYRTSVNGLTQTNRLEVLGPDTSGEVEPVLFGLDDGVWLGLGSDHTDRKAETMGIALSKQLCGKVVGTTLWSFAKVADHWDRLVIRSYATIEGKRVLYQEGTLGSMRTPQDLLSRYDSGARLSPGAVMFCGTVGAIGGIRPASRFEMELEDPVLNRKMAHAYDIVALPVVA